MVEFIQLIFLTSLWIWGVHAFFQLTGLAEKLNWIPARIRKPIWDCPPCCSSVHGTVSYFIFTNYPDQHIIPLWVAFCFILCGLNYIIKEHLYV